ncbi:MAG TPA: nitroreductase [Castellaniella sp.]|uniref:nitroreductase family protein n=1 Tax=Castellaniella sp. TaxID=1955812 RepID=UPI002EDF082A
MSDFLQALYTRRSVKYVQAPGPSQDELSLILQAAVCAPDHGAVHPWRFKVVRGADIPMLIDLGIEAGVQAGSPLPEPKIQNARKWLSKVPLMIAVGCAPDPRGRIREQESLLSVGAAVMNMLNAAHALGYCGFWSTGMGTYLDGVGEALGFDTLDMRFMGYVSLGTPIDPLPEKQRPDYRDFVSEWHAAPIAD